MDMVLDRGLHSSNCNEMAEKVLIHDRITFYKYCRPHVRNIFVKSLVCCSFWILVRNSLSSLLLPWVFLAFSTLHKAFMNILMISLASKLDSAACKFILSHVERPIIHSFSWIDFNMETYNGFCHRKDNERVISIHFGHCCCTHMSHEYPHNFIY